MVPSFEECVCSLLLIEVSFTEVFFRLCTPIANFSLLRRVTGEPALSAVLFCEPPIGGLSLSTRVPHLDDRVSDLGFPRFPHKRCSPRPSALGHLTPPPPSPAHQGNRDFLSSRFDLFKVIYSVCYRTSALINVKVVLFPRPPFS